jgi:hypothetical protein
LPTYLKLIKKLLFRILIRSNTGIYQITAFANLSNCSTSVWGKVLLAKARLNYLTYCIGLIR